MKKLFVSIGLAAAGTASLQAQYAPDLNSMQTAKIWSVSASLRGFYDDNYNTVSSGPDKRGSYGFEVSPSMSLNVPLQQTELGVKYTYTLDYYQDRENLNQNPIDQTHQLDLWLDHAFTERWQTKAQDSFVVGQEPDLLNPSNPGGVPFRVNGNNIRNTASITLHTDWTRLFSTDLGYQNTFYDYQNSGTTVANFDVPNTPGANGASLAGLLNRVENLAWLNFNWQVQPETMVFVGYQFGQVSYIGDEPITVGLYPSPAPHFGYYYSDSRDNLSHYVYVGVQHNFLANLSLSAKGGAQYTDEYNDPAGSTTSISPYADISLIYTYAQGSYLQAGFTQNQNATDVIAPDASGHITQYQKSSVLYASINQQLTPKLMGSIIGHWQYSDYEGGLYASEADVFYNLGVNLTYNFTPHFSAEAGYNLDYLNSDISDRGYTRNRGYVGVTATY